LFHHILVTTISINTSGMLVTKTNLLCVNESEWH
jgi:hypothetical protein